MIEARSNTNLKYLKYHLPTKPSASIINPDITNINANKTFDKKLISLSINPTLVLGFFEFIYALVSFPA
jgi:hypothetical protein